MVVGPETQPGMRVTSNNSLAGAGDGEVGAANPVSGYDSQGDNGSKDTYATLLARSGNLVEAIEIENELVYFQPAYGTQLARFEQRLTEDEPIDLKPFASSKIIAIDAICNKRYFARHVTHTVIDIPSICEGQEIIFIRNARDTDKSLRYELDPKLMALPL